MHRTDSQLIAAALGGEVDAFRQLYERHWALAVGVALAVVRDRHLAEDAAQEAFAEACRQLAALSRPERFPGWLRTICRRSALKLRRRMPATQPLTVEPSAASTTEGDQTSLDVRRALDQLDEGNREVLILHYFSGLSYDEMSSSLGLSTAAIHGRLQRARGKLADKLGRHLTTGERHVPIAE